MALTTSLLGYWKFDDASGTTAADASGNSNTGALSSPAPSWATGKINDGLTFTGSSHEIVTSTNNGPTGTSAWSVSIWFKTTQTATGVNNCLFGWGGTGGATAVNINIENGTVWVRSYSGVTAHWGSGYNDGNWHHLVLDAPGGTYAVSGIVCYVDGTAISLAGSTGSTNYNLGSTVVTIGGVSFLTAWFTGTLDEAAIWSRQLSSTEVTQLYNSGSGLQYPFSVAVSASVTGVAGTAAIGTATVVAAAKATLTGVAGTGAAGSATVTGIANVTLTGAHGTGSAGTAAVTVIASITLTGVGATGSAGTASVTVPVSASATGVSATASAGTPTVTAAANIAITGISASGDVGLVSTTAPLSISVDLIGIGATGIVGNLVFVLGRWIEASRTDETWTDLSSGLGTWIEASKQNETWV